MSYIHSLSALWRREIVKFVRDRSRVFGALAQPILFWVLLGMGFQRSFSLPGGGADGVGYFEFLFPGIIALMILFTAIFSTISIVEERKAGFLQAALVAPVSRTVFVLGSTLGGTTLALIQAALLLCLLPFLAIFPSIPGLLLILALCILAGIAFTALGIAIAWRMETTRGFHAVMNLFLLPMWLISGAFFPYEGASTVLQWCIRLNPVSYMISGMRSGMYWPRTAPSMLVGIPWSLIIGVGFAAAMVGFAAWTVRKPLFAAH
ncbi:MAG: ABC transporter permease [Rhodothermales bacterium]